MAAPEAPFIDSNAARIALAAALGMFLGLEREWSQKSAGIRTFSLVSLLGAVFALLVQETTLGSSLLVIGGVLVIVQGVLLAVQGLLEEEGLSLTTSVTMLVAYSVGILVVTDHIPVGVTVAVLSSLLLVLKRELHSIAWGLSREELRSVTEFAILAFVIFPLLPTEAVAIRELGVSIEPRIVWAMVVTVAGIGFVNYAVVMQYGGRGIAVTGFFGGLASSTAVVGTMIDHVTQDADAAPYALASILLADAAMAFRNIAITVAFTLPAGLLAPLVPALVPLVVVGVGAVAVAAYVADWSESVEMHLESPFSMRNALAFGGVFLLVVVAGAVAQQQFGAAGFVATAALTGLVSSAGATTSAVALYRTDAIGSETAMFAVLLATAASIAVKAGLTSISPERALSRRVAAWSTVLIAVAVLASVATALVVT